MTHGPITKYQDAWAIGLMQIRVGASQANIASTGAVLTAAHSLGALEATKFMSEKETYRKLSGFPKLESGSVPLKESCTLSIAFKELTPYIMAMAMGIDPTASAAPAVQEAVTKVSAAGTTDPTKAIAVGSGAGWGVVSDEWTVVFTGPTAGKIYGKKTGIVHTFAALTTAMEPVHDSTLKYFSIPASLFTGTWAADQTYVFHTQAGGSSAYPANPTSWSNNAIALGALAVPAAVRVEAVLTFPNARNTMIVILPRAELASNSELDFKDQAEATPQLVFQAQVASTDYELGNVAWNGMPLGRILFNYV